MVTFQKARKPHRNRIDINNQESTELNDEIIIVPETISDVCSEVVSESILKAAIGNDEALTTFSRCNCNKSLSVSDLTLLTNIPAGLTMFDAQDSENEGDESDPTIAEHDRSLSRNLAGFNLKVDKVARDGDCAFRGVARMLRPICNPEQPEILNHLKSVGLCKSEDEDTITMRQLFVEEIMKYDEEPLAFFPNQDREAFVERG